MIFYKTSDIALVYFDKILKWLSLEIIKPWVLSGLVYTYLKTLSKANIELIFIHITEGKIPQFVALIFYLFHLELMIS